MYCDVCHASINNCIQRRAENIDGTDYHIFICNNCYEESLNFESISQCGGRYIKHNKLEELRNKMIPDIKEPADDSY